MNFVEAVKTCLLEKYFTFSGRASRSEFWWFILFITVVGFVIGGLLMGSMFATIDFENPQASSGLNFGIGGLVWLIITIAMYIPMLAAGSRRLHDTNRSGWWQLLLLLTIIPLIGLIGLIVLIVFWAMDSVDDGNNY